MQEAIAEEQKPVVVFTGEMVFSAQESPARTTGNTVIEGCCFQRYLVFAGYWHGVILIPGLLKNYGI